MANPQPEDGYTRIVNEVLEAVCRASLTGRQCVILLVIMRETWGWNRKEAVIPAARFEVLTGIKDKARIFEVLTQLANRQMITRTRRFPDATVYSINKNYDSWGTADESSTAPDRTKSTALQRTSSTAPDRTMKKTCTKTCKDSTPSGTQQLVALYIDLLTERLDDKPFVNGKRCGETFKRLLKIDPEEVVRKVLAFYVVSDKPFYVEKGWDIGMFERDYNGLKAQMTGKVKTSGHKRGDETDYSKYVQPICGSDDDGEEPAGAESMP